MEELVRIGSIYRTHGLKGEVKLIVERDQLPDNFQPDSLFIEASPAPVPHFCVSFKYLEGKHALLKLEGIDTIESARLLVKKEIYVPIEQIVYSDEPNELEYLLGYMMIDAEGSEVGIIEDILDMPMQQVAQINYKGHEALVPLMQQTILEINKEKKQLQVQIPEGLLDIYE